MIYTVLVVAASAALASAQATYNSTTGKFDCVGEGTAYCAGDSLTTNIILRCSNGVAQPGNCNDNLSGYFPFGVEGALCYQSSATSGDAACAKNCIVEGGSGNSPTFTLPNCTPSSPSTSSSAPSSTTSAAASSTSNAASSELTSTVVTSSASNTTSSTTTVTSTSTFVSEGTTITKTFTTTYCPARTTSTVSETPASSTTPSITVTAVSTLSTLTITSVPLSTAATTSALTNGTITSAASTESGSPTKTPIGPTSSSPVLGVTNGAASNSAGLGLACVGVLFAYLL